MEIINGMKFYELNEILDEQVGKIGTPERDEFDTKVAKAVDEYRVGEALKNERKKQNLTQEELGQRLGVQKSQVSRLESGKGMTVTTMRRVFKALGVKSITFNLDDNGEITLA